MTTSLQQNCQPLCRDNSTVCQAVMRQSEAGCILSELEAEVLHKHAHCQQASLQQPVQSALPSVKAACTQPHAILCC